MGGKLYLKSQMALKMPFTAYYFFLPKIRELDFTEKLTVY
jgi:hypothetical protein